jgi:hypothetical protein
MRHRAMCRQSLLALCLLCVLPAAGGAQSLTLPPDVAPWVAALPVVNGDTPAATRINAALADLDRTQQFAMTCEGLDPEGAYRTVEILSDGPAFLSLLVTIAGACEGASYPWSEVHSLTFDLSTGNGIDLMDYLPPGWRDPGPPDPQLFALYLDHVDQTKLEEDCLDALIRAAEAGWLSYLLGIDTPSRRLMIQPDGLLQVESGCEEAAWIPAEALRAAAFEPQLVAAVQGQP